jgi:hypothetical protein
VVGTPAERKVVASRVEPGVVGQRGRSQAPLMSMMRAGRIDSTRAASVHREMTMKRVTPPFQI